MLTIPSIDLVGVDVAITIKDEVFDKDLENKSSTRYKTIEKQVEKEVRRNENESSNEKCFLGNSKTMFQL